MADSAFTGSIPAIYHRYLGPLLFEPFARDLACRLGEVNGSVLETAAGTGILTRALVETLPQDVPIIATDLNPAMLDHAAQHLSSPRVSWRQANAVELPFDDDAFDAVVCQFGAMFFPDKVAGYAEARRVLKPGGRFIFNVWDSLNENVVAAVVHEAVAESFPDDPPRFLARAPYGYYDAASIREELQQAGFTDVELETVRLGSQASAAADPAIGYCKGSPLRSEIEGRDASRLDEVTEAATRAVAQRFGDQDIEVQLQAHVIVARST